MKKKEEKLLGVEGIFLSRVCWDFARNDVDSLSKEERFLSKHFGKGFLYNIFPRQRIAFVYSIDLDMSTLSLPRVKHVTH